MRLPLRQYSAQISARRLKATRLWNSDASWRLPSASRQWVEVASRMRVTGPRDPARLSASRTRPPTRMTLLTMVLSCVRACAREMVCVRWRALSWQGQVERRVFGDAVAAHLEVEMRSCGVAGAAHLADDVARADGIAVVHVDGLHVAVARRRRDDVRDAVERGVDRRAQRCGEVDPRVDVA